MDRRLAVAAALLTVAPVSQAEAGQDELRIVIMSFEGPGAKAVRNDLIKEMSATEGLDLVSRSEVTDEAKKLGIPEDSTEEKNLVKIGEHLLIDAIVMGTVVQEKNLKNLEVRVVITAGPDLSETLDYTWKSKDVPEDVLVTIEDDILEVVRSALEKIEKDKAKISASPEEEEEYEVEDRTPKKAKKASAPGERRGPVIAVHAGMLVAARKMKIDATSGSGIEYDGKAFPAFGIDLAFFPIRLATASLAADLGLAAGFRRSFLLESEIEGGGGEKFDTSFTYFDARLVYEIFPKKAPLVLAVSAGWGFLLYRVESSDPASFLPVRGFDYMFLLVGFEAGIKAVDPWLSISVGGDLRIPHAWGKAEEDYGTDASGFGGSARLGLSGKIAVGLRWSVGFEYVGLMTNHTGGCLPTTCRVIPGDKTNDHYISGSAKLGYAW